MPSEGLLLIHSLAKQRAKRKGAQKFTSENALQSTNTRQRFVESQLEQPLKNLRLYFAGEGVGAGEAAGCGALLVLPPLWVLLVFVAFLPEAAFAVAVGVFRGGSGCGFNGFALSPPVSWANARLPARNIANATVISFFIHFLLSRKMLNAQVKPRVTGKFRFRGGSGDGSVPRRRGCGHQTRLQLFPLR
jgi:hypothetical protein